MCVTEVPIANAVIEGMSFGDAKSGGIQHRWIGELWEFGRWWF